VSGGGGQVGLRVNVTNNEGKSSIHTISYYDRKPGSAVNGVSTAMLRFEPRLEPQDMNQVPDQWFFIVQDKVMEEYPVESSFGEHVMCYSDEDCLGVRETMQNIEGMCCKYCTELLASTMCRGGWDQWPVGSAKYFETTAAAVETCRTELGCVDSLPCIGCPLTCKAETVPPTTTTVAPTTTPPPETTPPPLRSTVQLGMTVPGETTTGWCDLDYCLTIA